MCGALLAGLWPAHAQAAATGSFQRSISIDEAILLDVSTGSGAISIRAGTPGQVEITGHIKVRGGSFLGLFGTSSDDLQAFVDRFESEPPVILENGRLKIGHVKDRRFGRNASISYEIVVPLDTEVKSHTGSGSQEIFGVSGPVEAGTGSGRLKLTDIGGAVSARSGSGSIIAEGIAGSFEAHSGSGKVRLTQKAPGDVVVTTGSGSSELHGIVGALRVKAGSGRIVVDGQQTGPWNLDTGSGSVSVSLPVDAAFQTSVDSARQDFETTPAWACARWWRVSRHRYRIRLNSDRIITRLQTQRTNQIGCRLLKSIKWCPAPFLRNRPLGGRCPKSAIMPEHCANVSAHGQETRLHGTAVS